MKVKEIMKENPAFATLNTSLHNVAQMMMDNDCGCIPIVENRDSRIPLGVITDRDIACRAVALDSRSQLNDVCTGFDGDVSNTHRGLVGSGIRNDRRTRGGANRRA